MHCANCDKTGGEFLKTAYGDYLCEDCWDDYICSGVGKLEYLIGICRGDYPMSDFDADFLGEAVVSFKRHYKSLDLAPSEIVEITLKARALGLL